MPDEPLRSVAVFCGSSPGRDPAFRAAATGLGKVLASSGIRLVYGGGAVGLMGVLADAVLAEGGTVLGVITEALVEREVAHGSLTELVVVPSMHERKQRMADAADAFVMLPGGLGTLDEFFEAATWTQLGIHAKPCGVLDVGGYFEPLRALLDDAVTQRFLTPEHRDLLVFGDEPRALLDSLRRWAPPSGDKWLDRPDR